ncbi:hypothetical protein [Ferruginivarius sediminum]|nr:hypothetical protein [Ferruginivarius sediminum]
MHIPGMLRRWLLKRVERVMTRRAPDFTIGGTGDPYLQRWWLLPRNRVLNVYLHRFLRSDDDRALHDHPWRNVSVLLAGGYLEEVPVDPSHPAGATVMHARMAGQVTSRGARAAHRVELMADRQGERQPAITVFLTGPRVRDWGFWCAWGWRPWREFVDARDAGAIGRGCE